MQSVTQLRRVGGEGRKHSRRERGVGKGLRRERKTDTLAARESYLSLGSTLSTVYMQQFKRQYTHR